MTLHDTKEYGKNHFKKNNGMQGNHEMYINIDLEEVKIKRALRLQF